MRELVTPALSHKHELILEVEALDKITVPQGATKRAHASFVDYTSRGDEGHAVGNLPVRFSDLDYDYLLDHFASVSGFCVSTPPSKYRPRSDERAIWFGFNILDFSGEQWRDFKGVVYLHGLERSRTGSERIDYLDFGHLRLTNLSTTSLRVNPGCVVKNVPEGMRIYYSSIGSPY